MISRFLLGCLGFGIMIVGATTLYLALAGEIFQVDVSKAINNVAADHDRG